MTQGPKGIIMESNMAARMFGLQADMDAVRMDLFIGSAIQLSFF